MLFITFGFFAGVGVGYLIHSIFNSEQPIGDLRVDESDPSEQPYLFLELKTSPDHFKNRKRITLNVKAENYLSQN